jgi:hypothetical protein
VAPLPPRERDEPNGTLGGAPAAARCTEDNLTHPTDTCGCGLRLPLPVQRSQVLRCTAVRDAVATVRDQAAQSFSKCDRKSPHESPHDTQQCSLHRCALVPAGAQAAREGAQCASAGARRVELHTAAPLAVTRRAHCTALHCTALPRPACHTDVCTQSQSQSADDGASHRLRSSRHCAHWAAALCAVRRRHEGHSLGGPTAGSHAHSGHRLLLLFCLRSPTHLVPLVRRQRIAIVRAARNDWHPSPPIPNAHGASHTYLRAKSMNPSKRPNACSDAH